MVKVRRSAVVDVPIEALWAVLRDFNSHARWHPAIAESVIEEGREADEVGAVRRFSLADGGLLREQLLTLDDETRSFSYCLLEAPLPLMNYVAQVRLRPVTDSGKTYWEWESRFDPPPGRRVRRISRRHDSPCTPARDRLRDRSDRHRRRVAASRPCL